MPTALGLGLSPVFGMGGTSLFAQVQALFNGGTVTGVLYDISQLNSLYEDRSASPSTPASADGAVGTILDLSGNDDHWIAPSDAARAVLRQSGNYYYLDFNGLGNYYDFTTGFTGGHDIFTLLKNYDPNGIIISKAGDSGSYIGAYQDGYATSTFATNFGSPSFYFNRSILSPSTRDQFHTELYNGPVVVSILDGVASVTFDEFGGYEYGAGIWLMECDFYGMAIIETQNATNRALIERWAASLGGVSL